MSSPAGAVQNNGTPSHPDSRSYGRVYKRQTSDILSAWSQFNSTVFSDDRTIPVKYLELIAVAVAVTTQCEYCIEGHTDKAVDAGATDAELAEAVWVSATLRAGGAFAHGRIAFQSAQNHRHTHSAE